MVSLQFDDEVGVVLCAKLGTAIRIYLKKLNNWKKNEHKSELLMA